MATARTARVQVPRLVALERHRSKCALSVDVSQQTVRDKNHSLHSSFPRRCTSIEPPILADNVDSIRPAPVSGILDRIRAPDMCRVDRSTCHSDKCTSSNGPHCSAIRPHGNLCREYICPRIALSSVSRCISDSIRRALWSASTADIVILGRRVSCMSNAYCCTNTSDTDPR